MSTELQYKGYTGTVEWSDPDNVWHGRLVGVRGIISYEGDDQKQLEERFREAVEDYLDFCREKGIEAEIPQAEAVEQAQ